MEGTQFAFDLGVMAVFVLMMDIHGMMDKIVSVTFDFRRLTAIELEQDP